MERLLKLKNPVKIEIMTLKEALSYISSDEWDVMKDSIVKTINSITVELLAE